MHAIPPCVPRRHRQAGISLLQVMLILVFLGAVMATGFQLLQSRSGPQQAVDQEQVLAWADQAVASFAAANSRLPCPAATADGAEDCTSNRQKGFLPLRTLKTFVSDESLIGASGPGPQVGAILYLAYRPTLNDADLGSALPVYAPADIDGQQRLDVGTTGGKYDAINGLDFCAALQRHATTPLAGGAAFEGAGGSTPVAYALAIAGPTPGEQGTAFARFDERNADSDARVADPGRDSDAHYDDRLRARTFASLSQSVGCQLLDTRVAATSPPRYNALPTSAVDLVSDAVSITQTVQDTQQNTKEDAENSVQSGQQAVAFGSIAVVLGGVQIAATAIEIPQLALLLSQNIVRCVVSLGVECWRVPLSTAALITASVALGQAIGGLAANSAALAMSSQALDEARAALKMADSALSTGPVDFAGAIEQARLVVEGNCASDAEPVVSEVEINGKKEATVLPPTENCQIGMTKLHAALDKYYRQKKADQDVLFAHYINPWEETPAGNPPLVQRISGYGDMNTTDRTHALSQAVTQVNLARDLARLGLERDDAEGLEKGYVEQMANFQKLLAPSRPAFIASLSPQELAYCDSDTVAEFNKCRLNFVEQTDRLCRSSKDGAAERCQISRNKLTYVQQCVQNGVYFPNGVYGQPDCMPALTTAMDQVRAQITAIKQRQTDKYNAARSSGLYDWMTWKWIPEEKNDKGEVTKPGYYTTDHIPNRLRYPGNWFCNIDGSNCKIPIGTWLTLWRYGDHLPLVRNRDEGRAWNSYEDRYREYLVAAEVTSNAKEKADEAKQRLDAAAANYARLKSLQSNGGGQEVELWLGADAILKGVDDRGAVGPDRNANLPSPEKP